MIATSADDATPVRSRVTVTRGELANVAVGAIIAALLDAGAAFVVYVLIAHRYNFETLLQYIASGVMDDPFKSGAAGIGTAAIGFAIHGALAAGFAVFYAATLRPLARTLTGAVATGVIFGAVIWVVMAGAVLPILHVAFEPAGGRYWWAFLADHAFLVGVPIALAGSRPLIRPSR